VSKGNTAESDFILKAFNATELSWDAITHLYVGLHTADPGGWDDPLLPRGRPGGGDDGEPRRGVGAHPEGFC